MKTTVPFKQILMKTMLSFSLTVALSVLANAQSGSGGCSGSGPCQAELKFENRVRETGSSSNPVGTRYRFKSVANNVDALVTIDSLVNGATVENIDESGVGFESAFQPLVKLNGAGVLKTAYAVFMIKFVVKDGTTAVTIPEVGATAVDIDGTLLLKEFSEIEMGTGSVMSYLSSTPHISVLNLNILGILKGFKGANILGIDLNGIDTTAKTNMFSVTNQNVSEFKMRAGSTYTGSSTERQHSFYMKSFTYPSNSTLPVKLESFNAFLSTSSKVDLKWVTASEINVSHFVIEKSYDGTAFAEAATVFAYGNTSTKMNYAVSDNIAAVTSPVIYYRLRSVDIDGKANYSAIRIIRLSKQTDNTTATILTYPNPATNEVRITIPANWQNKKVVYEVFGANGQTAKKVENGSSSQTESLNISNLNSGLYIVRVSCNGETAQQKIVKQ